MKRRKYTKIKTNPEKYELRNELKELWLKTNKKIWKRLMNEIEKPTRLMRIVNVSKFEKLCEKDEKIVVPGKVLGGGELTKPLFVIAFSFSESAKKKIEASGGKWMLLKDYIKKNPDANLRIIG